jgi:2-dehydro-3-deoxygluconokinase
MIRKTDQQGSSAMETLDLSAVTRVAVIGECMLELSSVESESSALKKLSYGGDTLNTAVYLAGSGQQVSYFTALGEDSQSQWMIQQWQQAGIDCDHVRQMKGRVPGLYMIETDAAGERRFLYWRDSSPARELFDDRQQAKQLFHELENFELLYFSGVTLSLYKDAALKDLLNFLTGYRRQGGLVAFDSNYRPQRWPDRQRAETIYQEYYQQVDLALPTLEDDGALFNLSTPEALLEKLINLGVSEVVIKQGQKGCLVIADPGMVEAPLTVPAVKVDKVVDTTGAGDSFNGGYLSARIKGESILEAARKGHRFASQVVQNRGAVVPIDLG